MKKKLIFAIIILLFAALSALVYQNFGRAKNNSQVFSALSKLDGFDASAYEGKYFLIHFWAKWCEPCAEEIPHLLEFASRAKFPEPLNILAISLDKTIEDSKSILPNGGKNLPSNFHVILDPEHHVAELLGSYQYPETYFIGPQGDILEKWIGPQKWQKPEVAEFFKRKVAGE